MLAFDDIQHILLTCAQALTGRYEFLSFGALPPDERAHCHPGQGVFCRSHARFYRY